MAMEVETEMEMQMQMQMEMEMDMETVMVIFGSRKARSELRFASQRLWTSDFDVLEAAGAPRSDQESPKKPPRTFLLHPPYPIRRYPIRNYPIRN